MENNGSEGFLKSIPIESNFLEDYAFITRIGKGSYAEVDLMKRRKEPIMYSAVKRTKDLKKDQPESIWLREYNILIGLQHPNIIGANRIFKYHRLGRMITCLELEYFPGINLFSYIKNWKKDNPLQTPYLIPNQDLEAMTEGLLKGLKYLHSQKLVHRDIKVDNILWNQNHRTIKIVDFGFAGYYLEPEEPRNIYLANYQKNMGTPLYMPRESLYWKDPNFRITDRKDLVKVDIWGMGVVLYYVSMGYEPFTAKNYPEFKRFMLCPFYKEMTPEISGKVRQHIEKCLIPDPRERGTLNEMIANWENY